ncbi:endonuclease [Pyxidicoccus fallax]|uniref:Endonuclease n=1 Tax=Pyxidicoccus fallax TaxID=394095 RepID=A0A848LPL1_9BACT|nr:putative Ig domain-containing protein [Pyxidicoccus fallax]NMO19582.1 endonuclease [Pyxidicoccus fallax]NPC83546.1 endonuclease [Pyxidicoccus fallax]
MRFPRVLSLFLTLLLTACPGSGPSTPTDGGANSHDGGSTFLTLVTEELPPATVSQPYRVPLVASGGSPEYSWHLFAGSLPSGLTLSGSGEISGTPSTSTARTITFTVEVRDSAGHFARRLLGIQIQPPGFEVTTAALPDAYLGGDYSASLAASGGTAPYTWVLARGTLPSGVRLATDGRLSGTPVAPGTFSVTLGVQDTSGLSAQRDLSLSVFAPPSLSTSPLAPARLGVPYSASVQAAGGRGPLALRVSSGSLPEGLRLEGDAIVGTPTKAGTASFTLQVQDRNDRSASVAFQLTVRGGLFVATASLPDAYTDAAYGHSLSSEDGQPPYTWTLTAGTLPAGLRFLGSGAIEGTASTPGTFSLTVRVTDAQGATDSSTLTLTVHAPPSVSRFELPDAYVDDSYSATLTVTGGRAPYSWRIDSGTLPQGLSLTSGSGTISGTPGAPATTSVTVRVTDSGGRFATRTLPLRVYRAPSLLGPTTGLEAYVGEAFLVTYSVADGKPPHTFATSAAVPSWLRFSSTGQLSGTPAAAGSISGMVSVFDANEYAHHRGFSLTVFSPPVITSLQLPEARLEAPYSTSLASSGGKSPVTWSITSGSLPSGLSLSSSGGISGAATSGTSPFTARVTDANGRFEERPLTLPVYTPPRVTTATLPEAFVGIPYSATLTASGGRAPLLWSHDGLLPSGLVLDATTGVLSGTPAALGTTSFTVFVQDDEGLEDSRTLSLTARDASTSLTVGHWNIEWFGAPNQGPPESSSDGGTNDDLQIAWSRDILGDAGVNVWGLVEMVDATDFAALKAQLPQYSGFLANDPIVSAPPGGTWYSNGEQKPGILYDSSVTFQRAQLILTESVDDFGGRPPLRVDFTTRIRGAEAPLVVIVVHMKAFDDATSYGQRQRSGAALKSYLDTHLPFERVLVIGDWNDDLDRSITRNGAGGYLASPYEPFVLDTSRYTFVTQPLSLRGERTTTSYPDAIDHTLATNELAVSYLSGSVRVLRPDTWIPNYANTVSDHYPVISRYDLGNGGSGPAPTQHLFINEVLANEPAPDGGVGDPQYEFIEVVNGGTTPADLSGWSLWDSSTQRHLFPSGTSLAPGKAFVVYGGPRGFPPGTANTLAASTGRLGLDNDGDVPSLRAPDGGVVDSAGYESTTDNVSINRMPDATRDGDFVLHTTLNPGLGSSAGRRADGGSF